MARGPCTFKQADIRRAIQAVRGAGLQVSGVTVDPQTGKIEVEVGKPRAQDSTTDDKGENEWDRV
jgi:hypothetical protein